MHTQFLLSRPFRPLRVQSARSRAIPCAAVSQPALEGAATRLRRAQRGSQDATALRGAWAPHLARALEHYNAAEEQLRTALARPGTSTPQRAAAQRRVRTELWSLGNVIARCRGGSYGPAPTEAEGAALLDTVDSVRSLRRSELAQAPAAVAPAGESRSPFLVSAREGAAALADAGLAPAEFSWLDLTRTLLDSLDAAEFDLRLADPAKRADATAVLCGLLEDLGLHLREAPQRLQGPAREGWLQPLQQYVLRRREEFSE